MSTQPNNSLLELIHDLIHEETQVQGNRVDLTVNRVFELTEAGALDFGGSEFEPAETQQLEPVKKNPDDDYGWWHLDSGTYQVEYNEQLSPGEQTLLLVPLQRVIKAGASHEAYVVTGDSDTFRTVLHVGDSGCNLKENCRLTGVHLLN